MTPNHSGREPAQHSRLRQHSRYRQHNPPKLSPVEVERRILDALGRLGEATAQELANALGTSRQNVVRCLPNLVKRGSLVEIREPLTNGSARVRYRRTDNQRIDVPSTQDGQNSGRVPAQHSRHSQHSHVLMRAALAYAQRGWHVFPCKSKDKTPLTPHGVKDATTHPVQIQKWWGRWPDANIAVACGPSGLVVIDIDPNRGGYDAWGDLCFRLRLDDETPNSITGTGGAHYFYQAPPGVSIRNSAGKLGPGLDVRANGGYVILPPSTHPNGTPYEWAAGFSPEDLDVKPLPEGLLHLLDYRRTDSDTGKASQDDNHIPEGRRNATLTSIAGTLRRRGLSAEEIEAALLVVNKRCDPPLDDEEVARIAASVSRYAPDRDVTEDDEDLEDLQKDYLHALALSRLFLNRYRWAEHIGKWMEYINGVWRPIPEERVAKMASETLRTEYARRLAAASGKDEMEQLTQAIKDTCYYARMTGALAFLKGWDGILTHAHEWDANPWLLNVANGTVDLKTQTLKPHNPADLLTKQAPVHYNPDAIGTAWEAHITRFLPNPNIRRQVQRDLGLALVGATLEETLPIWHGTGANGKSTTARVLMAVLGDYAIRAAPNLLIQSRHEEHPTGIADLAGRRLAFSIEVDDGRRLAEALVKELTGGDRKKARFMRQDFFEFEQTFTIFLLVNHKPVITGTDQAIWRRIRLVPWEYTIPQDQRRPQEEVVNEFTAEASAILNWLLQGLADWQQDHRWTAPEVLAATEAYRLEQDILGGFLGDCCELGPRFTVGVGALYEAYSRWCNDAGEDPVSKNRFGTLLRQRGIGQTTTSDGTRKWVGLRLQTQAM